MLKKIFGQEEQDDADVSIVGRPSEEYVSIARAKLNSITDDKAYAAIQSGATPNQLVEAGLANSERTARRWVQHFHEAEAALAFVENRIDVEQILSEARHSRELAAKFNPIEEGGEFWFDDSIVLSNVGCMHLGSLYVNADGVRGYLEDVLRNPRFFMSTYGDDTEGYLPGFMDVSSTQEQALGVVKQRQLLRHVIGLFAAEGKILYGNDGQHGDRWAEKRYGSSPIRAIYNEYHIPFFVGYGYTTLHVGEQTYHIVTSHGFRGFGSSMYNPTHAHIRVLREKFPSADVIVQADFHNYAVQHRSIFVDEFRQGLRESPYVTFVQIGTAKNDPEPYQRRGCWDTGIFAWPFLHFSAQRHWVKNSLDIRDPLRFIEDGD